MARKDAEERLNVGALLRPCHVTAAGITAGWSAQRWNLPGTKTGTSASNDTSLLVLFLFLGCCRSRCWSFLLVGVAEFSSILWNVFPGYLCRCGTSQIFFPYSHLQKQIEKFSTHPGINPRFKWRQVKAARRMWLKL